MTPDPGTQRTWQAFFRFRRVKRHLPPEVRARVLARGSAVIASGPAPALGAPSPLREVPPQAPAAPRVARVAPRFRLSLAASVALAAGAVGAVVAVRSRPAPVVMLPAAPEGPAIQSAGSEPGLALPAPLPAAPPVAAEAAVDARSAHPRHMAAATDLFTAELALLQRAHAAYTRHDFGRALVLITEHARQFPRGRLAEEREALRVRSLQAAGRAGEARQAAAAFAARFPRSILLPGARGGENALE